MKVNLVPVALSKLSSLLPWAGGTLRVWYLVKNLGGGVEIRRKQISNTINLKVALDSSHIFF